MAGAVEAATEAEDHPAVTTLPHAPLACHAGRTAVVAAMEVVGATETSKEARNSHQDSQAQPKKLKRPCCQNSRTRASSATGKSRYERE